MAFVRATVVLATVAATITAAILLLALRSAAVVAVFSPVSRFLPLFKVVIVVHTEFSFASIHLFECVTARE